jgi:hypothetical protein
LCTRSGYTLVDEAGQAVSLKKLKFDIAPMRIFVRSNTTGHAVVGVAIAFSRMTLVRSVKVMGRTHMVSSTVRKLFFALKPSEVSIDNDVPIVIDHSGRSFELSDLDVYMCPWKRAGVNDWVTGGSNLNEFTDVSDATFDNDRDFISAALSAADIVAEGEADAEGAVSLLVLMYARSSIAHFCRRAVLKALGYAPELPRLWRRAIAIVCESGNLADDMRALFWRDFALLPQEEREKIDGRVWRFVGDSAGPFCIIAGLWE